MDIVDAILDNLVSTLGSELQDPYPTTDPLRPKLIQRGMLQDDPEQWSPYILLFHHPTLGSVPDEEYEPEMGATGRIFRNHVMLMGRVVVKDAVATARQRQADFLERTRVALVKHFDLGGLETTAHRVTGCNKDFIDRVRTHETGGEQEWHMSFVIECHYRSEPK